MLAIVRGVVAWLLLVTTLVGFSPPPAVAATACTGQIDVWYGNSQTFGGAVGTPQPWVNILGNASGVPNLYYRLNQAGDPNPTATDATETLLTQGTGTGDSEDRRLLLPGDFNVDLGIPGHTAATNNVTVGANTVQIVARDAGGAEICTEPVTVTYQSPTAPGAPFTIDWADAFAGSGCVVGQPCGAINDVAQVIDGKWELTAAGVRTLETGYDRGIAIGDVGWDEYEISAPITIHELASPPEQDRWGGAGFLTGWNGHTDLPNYTYNQGACGGVGVQQPKCGWEPLGAIGWHRPDNPIDPDDPLPRIELFGDGGTIYGSTPMTLVDDPDTTYNFKMRVENIGGENTFRFKVWLVGGAEPDWQITGSEPANHDGAILLLAHHYDVTFGNVTVQPLGLAPVADDDAATVADLGLASVDVLTNDSAGTPPLDPATVAVVSPPSNGSAIPDPATGKIIYTHTATGTTSDSFTYTVADASAQVSNQATVSITITAGETQRKILDLDRPYWKDSYFPENIDPDENPSTLPNDEQFPPIVDQPTTWTGSPNYRQGNWYTRIHVKDKPAPAGEPDKEMWMQLCLWQGPLAAPTGETCTRVEAGQVAFSTEGVHYFDLNSPTMWWNKPGLPFDWAQPASVVRFLLKDAASGFLMNTTRCGDFCYPGTDVDDWMPVDMDVEVIAVGQNATLNPPASWQGECPSEWSPGCSVQTPVVAIDSPLDGSSFMVGDLVEFTATVIDDESGLEPSITWSSTPTGVSGSGPAVSTSSLAAGSYEVTAEVTDSDSLTGSDTITVIVEPPPVNDPILWLALDEGSGALVADASGNGNDGTLMGGPSFVADTNDASSFSVDFDGVDDWVDIGAVDVAGSGLTLVTHFRADSFPGTSRDARMISKATSPARDDHVFMLSTIESGSETRLRGRVRVGGVTTELIADSGDLALDTWYHGALTYEGTTVRLFLDGVEVGATPLTGAVDQDPVLAVAGAAQPGGADKLWDGRLDDIRIFERGLSPGEVAWLAANTVPVAVDGGGVTTVAVPVDVTLSGSDVDDDELIFEIVGSPSDGVLGPISGGDCSGVSVCTAVVSYSPRVGFDGTDSFTFSVSDGVGLPAVGTIMVEVIPLPEVSVMATDADAAEAGLDVGAVEVSRTGSTVGDLVVNLSYDGSATIGDDYVNPGTPVTIPNGSTSVDVTITPVDDDDDETDETVVVSISADPAYEITGSDATVTIVDDDELPGRIGNLIWLDVNGNGVFNPTKGDVGIDGVTVELWDETQSSLLDSVVTGLIGGPGGYRFDAAPDTYYVKVVAPSGRLFTQSNVGTNDSKDSDADASGWLGPITIISGVTNNTWDAGLLAPGATGFAPISIGNTAWWDVNGDGARNGPEPRVEGMTVELLANDGSTVLFTTTTNASGTYKFIAVEGEYHVRFTAPSGSVLTTQGPIGGSDEGDSDADPATGVTDLIVVASGIDKGWDAGVMPAGATPGVASTLGDRVWEDGNANGVKNSNAIDPGFPGVTVELWSSDQAVLLKTDVTDADGFYKFKAAPGPYLLKVLPPVGYGFTAQNVGADDARDSDFDPATGWSDPITLAEGVIDKIWDAGLLPA